MGSSQVLGLEALTEGGQGKGAEWQNDGGHLSSSRTRVGTAV